MASDECTSMLIASLTEGTGNRTTAFRIAEHLGAKVHSCREPVEKLLPARGLRTLIVLHALRCSSFVLAADADVWVIVVLGGTDINENVHQSDERRSVILRVLRRANRIVAFSPQIADLIFALGHTTERPHATSNDTLIAPIHEKVVVIYPTVHINTTRLSHSAADVPLRQRFSGTIGQTDVALLLPAGIRPVKDPLFVVDAIHTWNEKKEHCCRIYLVIVGPVLDEEFASTIFFPRIADSKYVFFHPAVTSEVFLASVAEFTALINTSTSEGLSNSILEALALNTAVIARDIPGNRQIITHMQTGMLFTHPEQLPELACQLFADPDLKATLQANGHALLLERFSSEQERQGYQSLLPS